jgi:UDP-glucose 4-epimerase
MKTRVLSISLLVILCTWAAVLLTKGRIWKRTRCSSTPFADVVQTYRNSQTQSGSTRTVRVLITGAAGFVASHVADFCQNRLGFQVVAVDNLSGGFKSNTNTFVKGGGVFVVGDLQDVNVVDDIFAKHGPFDHVFHLAAYAAEGLSHFVRHFNYMNNLGATVLLINAAVRQEPQVKTFVFTSSIAAYGASDGKLPLTEESPQRPEDPYGIAKHSVEMDLKAAHDMFGLNFIIFRPHNVYGPRQNIADKFRNAIGIFMNQILRGEAITIFGDGTQRRAFSFIDDVAPLIAASPIFPGALNQDFFVGVDEHHSIFELSSAVQGAMQRQTEVKFLDARKEVEFAYASHSKLRCVFNPPRPVTLAEGLERTAMFARRHGAFPPTGYEAIEVCNQLPPSWMSWFNLSDPEVRERKCERRHKSIHPRKIAFQNCADDKMTKNAGFRESNLPSLSAIRVSTHGTRNLLQVACMIYTCSKTRQRFLDQLQTWLIRCDHIFAFSDEKWSIPEYNVTTIKLDPDPGSSRNLWGKLRMMWSILDRLWCPPTGVKGYKTSAQCVSFDLLLVCGDDTYVVVENMKTQLTQIFGDTIQGREIYAGEPFPYPSPWWNDDLGDPFLRGIGPFMYNSGAGYFVSWETMQHLLQCQDDRKTWAEDVATAKCLLSTGSSKVKAQRLTDNHSRPLVLWDLDERDISRESPFIFARTDVSPHTFLLHGVSHQSLFRLHNMIYDSFDSHTHPRRCASGYSNFT